MVKKLTANEIKVLEVLNEVEWMTNLTLLENSEMNVTSLIRATHRLEKQEVIERQDKESHQGRPIIWQLTKRGRELCKALKKLSST